MCLPITDRHSQQRILCDTKDSRETSHELEVRTLRQNLCSFMPFKRKRVMSMSFAIASVKLGSIGLSVRTRQQSRQQFHH